MFLETTSSVWSLSVGLNSTSEVPAKIDGVCPGPAVNTGGSCGRTGYAPIGCQTVLNSISAVTS